MELTLMYAMVHHGLETIRSPLTSGHVLAFQTWNARNPGNEECQECQKPFRKRLLSAYTPEAGCTGSEKESFCEQFKEILRSIPAAEVIIVGGHLNDHVDIAAERFEHVHVSFGYGHRKTEGENILRTCIASDLAVVNTFFQKTPQHLITYKSGSHSTQIDYLLTRRCHVGKGTNCKVIPGESLTAQHRLLVMDYVVTPKKKETEKCKPRIRWWLLNGTMQTNFRAEVESQNMSTNTETVQEVWDRAQSAITTAGEFDCCSLLFTNHLPHFVISPPVLLINDPSSSG
nr:craniofacial development protein 2-like [Danaus plexippus plexippus]